MNDQSSPGSPLETIRAEIDGIDRTLLSLLADRLRAVDKMSGLKPAEHGLPIRPGREVALLRRLVAEAPAPLEREFVLEIWRAVIAASLRRQRVIDVVVGGGRSDPTRLFDIARRHFGARTRIKDLGEPQAALQKAAENPDTVVAVTTWPAAPGVGAWWPALSERRFHALHIIAGLPVMGGADEPEAAVFAASATEEAGNDATMLIAFDPHHRLQRALNETGLTGREIARAEPRVLVRVDGFLGLDDPRAAALTRSGMDSVRVLGSYARV
ncbi:MAG: chorismate mutase [Hyphomonadaceae bacterium]|nr:chorismate mutase [Hyphomonadaceae bacterium]